MVDILSRKSSNRLVACVLDEMSQLKDKNCDSWLTRVGKIEHILGVPQNIFYNKTSGKKILKLLKSKYDCYFLQKINEIKKSGSDNLDHNKLRTYKTFKSSFTREPYIDLIQNRNQRCFLSRLRTSSHNLRVELGRHTRPVTPFAARTCRYCPPPTSSSPPGSTGCATTSPPPDTEFHFLMECRMFAAERHCLLQQFELMSPDFRTLSEVEKFKTLLCPVSAVSVKLVNRFIKNMFESREKYDNTGSTTIL